jgi:predicted TIM-barrel fold metal-dependent hydrolase
MHIIDCDVHQSLEKKDLLDHLPAYYRQGFFDQGNGNWNSPIGVLRADAVPPGGGVPGSDPGFLLEHHVEQFGITRAILTGSGILSTGVNSNSQYAVELFRAYNDVLIEKWLNYDERYYGALLVAPQDPFAAAKEIRRVGSHPKIVQVLFTSGLRTPLGQRYYWPIYEACVEMGLPCSVHPGTEGRGIANGFIAGPPSTYIEWHTNIPQNYMGHVVSLVLEGVFEQFPELKFIAVEGGLAWIPGVLWRMDKNWKALRSTVPWIKRLPSEYAIDHLRFTTQPMEEPTDPSHFEPLMEMIEADKTLMFSSDYPHWDNDSPAHSLPRLSKYLEERIMYRTAAELYGFTDLLEEVGSGKSEVGMPEPAAAH